MVVCPTALVPSAAGVACPPTRLGGAAVGSACEDASCDGVLSPGRSCNTRLSCSTRRSIASSSGPKPSDDRSAIGNTSEGEKGCW